MWGAAFLAGCWNQIAAVLITLAVLGTMAWLYWDGWMWHGALALIVAMLAVAAFGIVEGAATRVPSEVREGGMSGRNEQRKPGTTRGSPRRSRTAKASRISRYAVKSRCTREWDGWGRLSGDGPRQQNSNQSEDPWGGGRPTLHGGARSSPRPDTVRDYRR